MNTNYVFPMPLPMHIVFCIIGLAFFLLQYYRKRYTYYLLLAFAIPSTLLIYFCKTDISYTILGIEEFILFILIIVSMILTKRKLGKEEKQAVTESDNNVEVTNGDSNT